MFKSLISRFLIFILSFTVATTYFTDALIDFQIKVLSNEYLQYEFRLVSESLDLALIPLIEKDDIESVQRVLINVGKNPTIDELYLVDSANTVIASTDESIIGEASEIRKEAEDSNGSGTYVTILTINKKNVQNSGSNKYELIIKLNDSFGNAMAGLISKQIMYIYLSMQLVMIIGIILIFYRLISAPIGRLNLAAREIKDSNYKIRIKRESDDEIGQLAKTFNEMTESIEENIEELKSARIKAEISSEAKMRFIANTSHEIRTPLNTILGFSDILSEIETDVEKKSHLDIIKNSGDHLLRIINDILDISKLENDSLKLEEVPFTMRSEMYDISKMFEMEILRKDLRFSSEVTNRVPRIIYGDILRIKQVIINLINNAIKFTVKGNILILIDYELNNLKVNIKDTGIGINEENQNHIFENFTQGDHSTTRLYGGTGLGLAICKKIIENMHGDIDLISEIGKGTSITINIPLKESSGEILGIFDADKMVKNWLGSDILVSDLVLSAVKEMPRRIETIRKLRKENNFIKLYDEAHIIKGLSGNFRLHELYEPASDLCAILKDNNHNPNEVILDISINNLSNIINEIPHNYLDTNIYLKVENEFSDQDINAKVLVAEDVFENWLLIKYILKSMPLHLEHAENGIHALTMLENNDYDLLLLDMQMPYMGGKEIIGIIRNNEKLKDLKVIIVTANATKKETDEYLALGCDYVIPKPINKDKLREKVIELIKN